MTVTQLVLPTRVELVYRPYQDRVLTVRLRKYMVAPAGLEPNASGDWKSPILTFRRRGHNKTTWSWLLLQGVTSPVLSMRACTNDYQNVNPFNHRSWCNLTDEKRACIHFRLSRLLILVNLTSKFIRLSSSHHEEVSIIANHTTQLRVVK